MEKEISIMAKEVKVLVACGSGVATSTIAQEEIKDIEKMQE